MASLNVREKSTRVPGGSINSRHLSKVANFKRNKRFFLTQSIRPKCFQDPKVLSTVKACPQKVMDCEIINLSPGHAGVSHPN